MIREKVIEFSDYYRNCISIEHKDVAHAIREAKNFAFDRDIELTFDYCDNTLYVEHHGGVRAAVWGGWMNRLHSHMINYFHMYPITFRRDVEMSRREVITSRSL